MIEISIVIPSYNRAKRLRNCLRALAHQTQSASTFEVIVVVDGSTDETVEMLKSFVAPYTLRTIWQNKSGQPSALNRGISSAIGRYCLFIDDDIVADPPLVAEHLRAQHQYPNTVAIGQITLSLSSDTGWYTRAFARGWRDHYTLLNSENYKPTWEDCYSGNMSAPREALLVCGGFDVNLVRGFDIELAKRLEKQGISFVYIHNALGCQDEQKDFHSLSRDSENAGKMDATLYKQNHHKPPQALASFSQGSWRKVLLHRLLLGLRVPPRLLELFGRLIRNPSWRYSWFSVIQKYCYWRGVRKVVGSTALWRQLTSGTVILMYHAIGFPHEPASPFVIPAHRFRKQMAWLKRLGYQPISLAHFLDCQQDGQLPPARAVVITFDDGYTDNYVYALPILHEYQIPATIFLVNNFIGLVNEWDSEGVLKGRSLMSWPQIQEIAGKGIDFGAHSNTHPVLTALSSSQARNEITDSRNQLEEKLGMPVHFFAYPYGEYDLPMQVFVREAGFKAACTVDAGLNTLITPSSSLRRTEIQGTDSLIRYWLALWIGDGEAFWWRRTKIYKNQNDLALSVDDDKS